MSSQGSGARGQEIVATGFSLRRHRVESLCHQKITLNFELFSQKDLTKIAPCNSLYDMKISTLTIRLDEELDKLLTKAAKQSGKSRSEIAREALRRQLRVSQFEAIRRKIMPFAEARGR